MFCHSPVLASLSIQRNVSEQKSMVIRSPTVCDDDAAVFFSPRSSCDTFEFFDAQECSDVANSESEGCKRQQQSRQPALSRLCSSGSSSSSSSSSSFCMDEHSDAPSTDFGSSAGASEAALSSDSETEETRSQLERPARDRSVSSSSLGSLGSSTTTQVLARTLSTDSSSCPSVAKSRSEDLEVVRGIRSTLNKLTIEKFDRLYEQLVSAGPLQSLTNHHPHTGLKSSLAVEHLVREVFEKASSQHHFLPMYTDLCVRLHDDDRVHEAFASHLLERCLLAFRELLTPAPALLEEGDEEAKIVRKIGAMGNVKFLGHLSIRGFLPQAEVKRLCESLLESQQSCREALEALAALLTVVGQSPSLEGGLAGIWEEVERLSKEKCIPPRDRFLLRDALDLRNKNSHRKATLAPDPTTLRAARREAPSLKRNVKAISSQAPRLTLTVAAVTAKNEATFDKPSSESAVSKSLSAPAATVTAQAAQVPPAVPGKFNKRAFRKVLATTMRDLTSGGSAIPEAVRIIREAQVPVECQTSEFVDILTRACEENRGPLRRLTFAFIGGLCCSCPKAATTTQTQTQRQMQRGAFEVEACLKGVALFFEEVYGDLLSEVPRLQVMVESEMLPTLASVLPAEALRNIVPKGISYYD